jgi:hypothetical protein
MRSLRQLTPPRLAAWAGLSGGSLAIATSTRLLGGESEPSPVGVAVFLAASAAVVWGATRARTAWWAAALCVVGALPTGFLTVALFPDTTSADFELHYLVGAAFVASQASIAALACRDRGGALDRSLLGAGLWLASVGAAAAAARSGPAALATLGLGLLVALIPIFLDVALVRAGRAPRAAGASGSPYRRHERGDEAPPAAPRSLARALRSRAAQAVVSVASGALSAAAAIITALAAWGLLSGFNTTLNPFFD